MRLPIYEHEHSRRVLPIFGQLGRIKNFNLLIFVRASNCMHTHTRGTKNCEERELKINSNYARSSGFDDPVSWNDSRFRGEGKGRKGGGLSARRWTIFSDTCARYLREIQLTAPLPLIAWKMHDRPQLNRIIARSNNYPCTCPTAADDFRSRIRVCWCC